MKTLSPEQWQKFAKNLMFFTAPALAVFFGQLATGVKPMAAAGVAILALWGIVADYFKKLNK